MSFIKRLPAPTFSQFIINTTCKLKTNHQTNPQRHLSSSPSPRPRPSFQQHCRSSSLQTTATHHPTSDDDDNNKNNKNKNKNNNSPPNQKATVKITILVQDHCSIQLQATLAHEHAKDAIKMVQLYHFYNMRCKYLDQAVLLALDKYPTTINLSPETLRAMEDRRGPPLSNNNNNKTHSKHNDAAMRYLGFDDLFTICQVIAPDLADNIKKEMKINGNVEDWVSRSEWEMWKRSMRDAIIAWYYTYYNSSSNGNDNDSDEDAVCRMRLNTTTPEGYSVVQTMEVKWEDDYDNEKEDNNDLNNQSSSSSVMIKKQLLDKMKASKFKSAIMGYWAQVDSNLATDDESTALKGLIDASWGVVNIKAAPHLSWSVTLYTTDDDDEDDDDGKYNNNFTFRGSNAQELKILGTCLYEMVSGEITGRQRLLNNRHNGGGGQGWWLWWPFSGGNRVSGSGSRKELSPWVPKDWDSYSFQAIEGSQEKKKSGGGLMYVVKKMEGDVYVERVMTRREMWALIDGMDALMRSHPSLGKKVDMGSMSEWLEVWEKGELKREGEWVSDVGE